MAQDNFPVVSVLITAYNREKYVAEAIESVLQSTYTNFELIIVDDCSGDKTFEIAFSFIKRDNRIKLFKNDVNLGQFGNRNKAAAYAKGKYIKYVDSDDILYPHSLQMMVDAMENFSNAGLAFCLTHGPCKKPLPYILTPTEALKQHFFEGGLLFCGPSGLIIKKDAFELVGGFEDYGMPSDNHFNLKIASIFPVVALSKDLFWWRQHPLQVFNLNLSNYQNVFNNYSFTKNIVVKYAKLDEAEKKMILKNQKKIFFMNIIKLAFKKLQFKNAVLLIIMYKNSNNGI